MQVQLEHVAIKAIEVYGRKKISLDHLLRRLDQVIRELKPEMPAAQHQRLADSWAEIEQIHAFCQAENSVLTTEDEEFISRELEAMKNMLSD